MRTVSRRSGIERERFSIRGVRTPSGSGFCKVWNLRFFGWERFAGIRRTRGSVSKTGSLSSRAFADCRSDERNMETTSRGLCLCSRNMRRINPAASRRRFNRAYKRGQSRGGRDDVSRETILGFSVRQAAARPVSPPLCHSDAPTQSYCQRRIFALDLQAVVSVGRQSSFLLRESSDYNCGCMMKRKDSSSQAPQNDKEKRNAGAAALNGEMFHVKQFIIHHSEF